MESLFKELDKDRRQAMIYGEFKTFFASLCMFKQGAAAEYDQSIYLSLYDGEFFKPQTCSKSRRSIYLITYQ